SCCSSVDPARPISLDAVASTPRRRSPSAIAGSTFSSRWNLIVRGIGLQFGEFFRKRAGTCLAFHIFDESLFFRHLIVNFVRPGKEVRERSVDLGVIELWERGDDLVDGFAIKLVPNVDVLDANASARDASFAATYAGRFDNLLCQGRQSNCRVA